MIARLSTLLCAMLMAQPLLCAELTAASVLQTNVVFSYYSGLATSAELTRRFLSPLNAMRVQQSAARSPRPLSESPIDLAKESFVVFVPAQAPSGGYALLVFVPPWETATLPAAWTAALERHGMLYVSAAKSGNQADVLDRREPLAVLAAENMLRRFSVDPKRVYVGGFSGGGRVALRVALAYPDVFHAALLNAGSDPIGTAEIALPPAELMHEFQESTRLVYLTGARDDFHLGEDIASRHSLNDWCVFDLVTESAPWRAHEVLDGGAFSRGLDALMAHTLPDARKLAACRARIDTTLQRELEKVEEFRAAGRGVEAQRLLEKLDSRYGGLASPHASAASGQ